MKGQITNVTLGGPPAITFVLTDVHGNAIVGLENNYAKAAGQALPTQKTVTATIAKLVPGTNGSPAKWVNYIVVRVDATKTTGEFTGLGTPTTDSNGTLTYIGDGQYKYVFATDITKVKAFVDASTDANKADVGDVTYEPGAPTRVVVQIAGAARGTGTNTANGVEVAPAVNLEDPLNLTWDSQNPQRDIARIESCNACHSKLQFHGSGARVDTDYCVVCHTNQRKYGQSPATLTTTVFKYDDGTSETFPSWSKEPRKFPDGNAMRDFPIMVHSIHRGEHLPVRAMPTDPATGKNTSDDYIDEVVFPQPVTNCVTCHTSTGPHRDAAGRQLQEQSEPHRLRRLPQQYQLGHRRESSGRGWPACRRQPVQELPLGGCDRDGLSRFGRPGRFLGRAGYPANTAENVPTPGFPSGQGPGDSALFGHESTGRGAQGRLRDQLRQRRFRQQGDDQVPHPVRRFAGHVPAARQCLPAPRHRRHAAALGDVWPDRGRRHEGGRLDCVQDRDGEAVSRPGGQHLHTDRA
jgi:hypothetical protein